MNFDRVKEEFLIAVTDLEWFEYWNRRLWQAVAEGDEKTEILATTMLYCKPK